MLLLSVLVACSDYALEGEKVTDGTPVEEGLSPAIEVDPPAIDFGAVDPAAGLTAAQVVTVTNTGDATLLVTGVDTEPGAPFVVTALSSSLIAPGGASTWSVAYDPSHTVTDSPLHVRSDDPDDPVVDVLLSGERLEPDLVVDPVFHDFGTLEPDTTAAVDITLRNDGAVALDIQSMSYTTASFTELSLRDDPSPLTLAPGASVVVTVDYAPTDDQPDEGYLTVRSTDPDEPTALADQVGNGRVFEGFSTGWYIVEDDTAYATTTDPSYVVETHGDPDGYWYEPSGVHAMIASTDPVGDWTVLHDYVVARAGAPTPVTGPLSFYAPSTVPCQSYASFNYILADFWIDPSDDPGLYQISSGTVDDGIKVLLNGDTVDHLLLGESRIWDVGSYLVPGEVNTLLVILMDDCAVDKYVNDLAFVRDGVIVSG